MTKILRSFLGQIKRQVTGGQQRFFLFQHFSKNWRIIREPEKLQRFGKAHSIALLMLCRRRHGVLKFDLRSTVWHLESKNSKKFFGSYFWFSKSTTFTYFASIALFLSWRVKWIIIWPEKVMLKIWPKVKVMTWLEKRSWCISVDLYRQPEHI